jgi:glycosyltransferase involved in cell wall biosynthesis
MTDLHICMVAPTASSILLGSAANKAGGAEMQLHHLGKGFVRRGARVSFVVEDVGQREVEHVDGMEVLRCPFRYYGQSWRYYPADTCHLMAFIRRLKPDVVLLKTPRTLTFPLALATRGLKTQVVRIMAHDSDCDRRVFPLPNVLYLLSARLMDGTVFQSEAQASLARRALRLKGRVIPNIAHGIPTAPPGVNARRDIDCLWVGTCNRTKDPLGFLEVVRALPSVKFTMIIASGPDKVLQASVTSQAATLANLDYRGFVPYCEVGDFYRRSKLLVHTSGREGFPNVFLQAWESATPVMSTHVDPDGVIARHGLGRVSGSIAGVIADVRALLADEGQRVAIGDACRQYLIRNHSPDVVIDQYLAYFSDLGVRGEPCVMTKTARA